MFAGLADAVAWNWAGDVDSLIQASLCGNSDVCLVFMQVLVLLLFEKFRQKVFARLKLSWRIMNRDQMPGITLVDFWCSSNGVCSAKR